MIRFKTLAAAAVFAVSLAVSTIASAAASTTGAAPASAQKRLVMPEDYMALRSGGGASLSPDGRWVIYTLRTLKPDPLAREKPADKDEAAVEKKDADKEESGKQPTSEKKTKITSASNLWLISSDPESKIAPRQLTFGDKGVAGAKWSPDGRFISFGSARKGADGQEAGMQVWLMPMNGGEAYALTEAKEGVDDYAWSPSGAYVVYLSSDPLSAADKERQEAGDDAEEFESRFRYTHIWAIDVASKKTSQITSGQEFTVAGLPEWSADEKRLAFAAKQTGISRDGRRDAYIVDFATKAVRKITDSTLVQSTPQWSPDGRTLALTALPAHERSYDSDFPDPGVYQSRLFLYDVAGARLKDLSSPQFDHSVSLFDEAWSPDGKRIMLSAGVGVYGDVFVYDLPTARYVRLTHGKVIGGTSFSRDRSKMVLSIDSTTAPSDLYVAKGDFSSPRRLTNFNPQVKEWALGETEVVQWKSSDGLQIEGILVKPVGFSPNKRYPLVVEVHGGPTGVFMHGFKREAQFWAGQGWAVLYPNPRGSTNYGEKFLRSNIQDWGGGDYQDIMSGIDALVARGIVDPDKLGIMGWSYGGYMAAWAVSQTNRFSAAVMGAGVSNNESLYGTTDVPGYVAAFFKGYPDKDTREVYRSRSPITHVDAVNTPLLILHGQSDPRVPLGQATEYYRALKIRGKTTALVLYPRAAHWVGEYYHQLDKTWRQYRWIAGHTFGDAPLAVDEGKEQGAKP